MTNIIGNYRVFFIKLEYFENTKFYTKTPSTVFASYQRKNNSRKQKLIIFFSLRIVFFVRTFRLILLCTILQKVWPKRNRSACRGTRAKASATNFQIHDQDWRRIWPICRIWRLTCFIWDQSTVHCWLLGLKVWRDY